MTPGAPRGCRGALLVLVCTLPVAACGGEAGAPAGAGSDEAAAPGAGQQALQEEATAEEVRAMLHASAGSWNGGDLEGFLDDYTDREDLTYVGSSGVRRGKEAVRQSYRASYWAPGARRDSLRFDSLEVRTLGGDHALALGRYVLYRPGPAGAGEAADSVTATGRFTLVLRREDDRWRIFHDHST